MGHSLLLLWGLVQGLYPGGQLGDSGTLAPAVSRTLVHVASVWTCVSSESVPVFVVSGLMAYSLAYFSSTHGSVILVLCTVVWRGSDFQIPTIPSRDLHNWTTPLSHDGCANLGGALNFCNSWCYSKNTLYEAVIRQNTGPWFNSRGRNLLNGYCKPFLVDLRLRLVMRWLHFFVVCFCYGSLDKFHRYYWSYNLRDRLCFQKSSIRDRSLRPSTQKTSFWMRTFVHGWHQ